MSSRQPFPVRFALSISVALVCASGCYVASDGESADDLAGADNGAAPDNGAGAELESCNGHRCTDADFDQAFERAARELQREGMTVDASVWQDEARYQRLFERMTSIARGASSGTTIGSMRAPLSSELQEFSDPSVAYCGPGSKENMSAVDLSRALTTGILYPGKCLNRACWEHDRCYETIVDVSFVCLWSSQTSICDERFFDAADKCVVGGECDFRCHIVRAMTKGLQAAHAIEPVTAEVLGKSCPACQVKTCEEIGAECGSIADGCGGVLRCGSCAAGDHCEEVALVCKPGEPTPPTPATSPRLNLPRPSSSGGKCCDYRATFDLCGPSGLPSHIVDCAASTSSAHPGCVPFDDKGVLFCCDQAVGERC